MLNSIRRGYFLAVAGLMLALSGCASSHMTTLEQPPAIATTPKAGTATMVFYRPGIMGAAYSAPVFDITDETPVLVGLLTGGRRVAYASPPGKRRFLVASETAKVLDADLTAGKTYYARVTAHFGWMKPRFSIDPILGDPGDELQQCTWQGLTPAAIQWGHETEGDIHNKKALVESKEQAGHVWPTLPASAGR
jgi:hypothetical protein